jgi:hypothetical protein
MSPRNDPAYAGLDLPSIAFCVPIWTRVGLRSSGFGTCTSSTPPSKAALIFEASISCGSVTLREKVPKRRSKR